MRVRTAVCAAAALACFAGNSLLCRMALASGQIDAASFTAVRLASGAALLALLAGGRRAPRGAGAWVAGGALFLYAAPFSVAYLQLGAATGALILFAVVQATMIGWGLLRGERPSAGAWTGFAIAIGGLIALLLPGVSAPPLAGAAAMAAAGIAWGVYSLRGRRSAGDARAVSAANFLATLPLAAVFVAAWALTHDLHLTARGAALAAISGALASGLGYALWYAALRGLSATRAAILQLTVPVLATAAAVVWLHEPLTARFVLSGMAILGGVGLVIRARN
jgi:drug/metabolite transporter (DMT)-like permease